MNESSPFGQSGQVRRLVVAIVVSTAAVLTAGIVLNEHPAGAAHAERVAAGTTAPGALAPAPVHDRRVQWRDPWKHPASDPSVPAAAKALQGIPDTSSGELAPTF